MSYDGCLVSSLAAELPHSLAGRAFFRNHQARLYLGVHFPIDVLGGAAIYESRAGFAGALFRYWIIGFAATAILPWLFANIPSAPVGAPRGRAA